MNWFRRGKIAAYLSRSFTTLAVVVVVMVIGALLVDRLISSDYSTALARSHLELMGAQIRSGSTDIINMVQGYVAPGSNQEKREALRSSIAARKTELDRLNAQAVDLTSAGDLSERAMLAKIQERVVDMNLQVNRVLDAYDQEGRYGPATTEGMNVLLGEYQQPLERDFQAFQDYEAVRVKQTQDRADRIIQVTGWALALAASVTVIFLGVMVAWSFRRIIIPLDTLNESVGQLRQGRLDYPVQVYGDDEIGALADTLRNMAAWLQFTLDGLEQNVAELRQTQLALERSEAHYRSLFDGVPVGLFRTTLEGQLLDTNPALVDMLGYPDKETLQALKTGEHYVSLDDRHRWAAETQRSDQVTTYEVQLRRLDGQKIWVELTSRAVRDEAGGFMFYEGSMVNISKRKIAEESLAVLNAELEQRVRKRTAELETANQELEAFAYSVSHDLRAPLRGIDGYSKLLLEDYTDLLDEDARTYLDNVRQATQRMGQLIEDLLKLSRVTRAEMNRSLVNISLLAEDALESLRRQDPERQVKVNIDTDLCAQGDVNLLRIVTENLLGNAWKFTRNTPAAQIEVGKMHEGGEWIFFVHDNGAGFEMKYAGKLFRAFQRLHDELDYEGTGIGLATVQRIIARHGGRVWAEGAPDKGATFFFTLP
jgi:PAS domain S-box-containing protein